MRKLAYVCGVGRITGTLVGQAIFEKGLPVGT